MHTADEKHFMSSFFARARTGVALLAMVAASTLTAGCIGGDDDDEDDEGSGGGGGTSVNVAGTWEITETVNGQACGEGIYTDTFTLTFTQDGNTVTFGVGSESISGTLSGNVITWTESYSMDGYSETVEGTATVSGDSMSGSTEWTYSGDGMSCSGSSSFTGTRESGTGGGGGGTGDQEVEPNDTPPNATIVSMSGSSVSYSGTVNEMTDDVDYFSFTPGSAGSYTITLTGFDPAIHDLDLAIGNSNYEYIDSSDSESSHESITVDLDGGLLYYIEVSAWWTEGTSPYTLTVTRN